MDDKNGFKSILHSFALLLGLILLGYFVFKGMKTFSDKDRVVTVKGLAEMNMTANAATITLDYSFSGDDLQSLMKQTETKKNAILDYLIGNGFTRDEINHQQP